MDRAAANGWSRLQMDRVGCVISMKQFYSTASYISRPISITHLLLVGDRVS